MAVSEAQKRANKKYLDAHFRQVRLSVPNEEADALSEYCAAHGLTRAGFIRALIKRGISEGFLPVEDEAGER